MSFAWHQIRDQLLHTSSTLRFQRRFETLTTADEFLLPFRDPAGLLDHLHRPRGEQAQKNLILTALTTAAQESGPVSDCALTMLLLALWPGMDAIRRRSISRRVGTPDEVNSDILTRTTEAIRCLDLDRVHRIAATILRNVERDMIRARQRDLEHQRAGADIDPDDLPDDSGRLHPAVEQHVGNRLRRLLDADAELMTRVAIEGYTQAEVAVQMGLSAEAARKRYQRATRRLRELLCEPA